MDALVVSGAVLLALGYVVRHLLKLRKGGESGCHSCHCSPTAMDKGVKGKVR